MNSSTKLLIQSINWIAFWCLCSSCSFIAPKHYILSSDSQPNVLFIMIDDLNDCVEPYNGHIQNKTPNLSRFAETAIRFNQAYTNAPMCGPSRASLFSGIYPHNSGNFYQAPWYNNEVLQNSKTMMEHFKDHGYEVLGTGKILHHLKKEIWSHFENPADYTPTPFDGSERLPHPDVPPPFSDIGWVDGSLGPFINLNGRKSSNGLPLHWTTGNPNTGFKPMRYINDEDRDPTPDETNAIWAARKIEELATGNEDNPFFLAVGFLRPHTPLVAPQKYFDMFPLEEIELSIIKSDDANDTHLKIAYRDGDVHALRFGKEMFNAIAESYGSTEEGLKRWTQAYLACVAAVDDNVGQVLNALDKTKLKDNTIVVIASDHGFHMGEKDYLYKNSLWEESTRIPLMMRLPGLSNDGMVINNTVSLIDIFPTLIDYCQMSDETIKNNKGHALDGTSLRHLIEDDHLTNNKIKPALTVVYAGDNSASNPADQHYTLRDDRYRYILYNTGDEELYDHQTDPHEWDNLIGDDKYDLIKSELRLNLKDMLHPLKLNGFEAKK